MLTTSKIQAAKIHPEHPERLSYVSSEAAEREYCKLFLVKQTATFCSHLLISMDMLSNTFILFQLFSLSKKTKNKEFPTELSKETFFYRTASVASNRHQVMVTGSLPKSITL